MRDGEADPRPILLTGTGSLLLTLGAVGLFLAATIPVSLERQRLGLSDWAFDLAFFHSLIAHASAGDGFVQTASTHELNGLLGLSHAFWTLPLYVPIYHLFPGLKTLLVLQSLTVGLLGVGLERLLHRLRVQAEERLLLVLLLLSSPGLVRLAVSDFNPVYLALPLLLLVYWALQRGKAGALLAAGLALACVREEMPVVLGLLGLIFGLQEGLRSWLVRAGLRPRAVDAEAGADPAPGPAGASDVLPRGASLQPGLSPQGRALLVLAIAAGVYGLQVWLRPRMGYYLPLDRPLQLLSGLALPPGPPLERRVLALLAYLPPFSVLGVLAPELLVLGAPLLLWLFLRSPYEWWHLAGPYVHHPALLTGIAILAGALGAARALRWMGHGQEPPSASADPAGQGLWRRLSLRRMQYLRRLLWGAGLVLLVWQLGASREVLLRVTGRQDAPAEQQAREAQVQAVWSLLEQLPPEAPVAADYRFIAWLSGTRSLYSYQSNFGLERQQSPDGPPTPGLDQVDWVLLDEAHFEWLARLNEQSTWRRVGQGEGYALYRRLP